MFKTIKLYVCVLFIFSCFFTNLSYAKIIQSKCTVGIVNVWLKVDPAKEKWIGASFRKKDGGIIDLLPKRLEKTSNLIHWQYNKADVREINQYRVSTWQRYEEDGFMYDRVDDTDWTDCQ